MPREADVRTRAFWSGTLTFGLVSIPVNLFPANRSVHASLRMVGPKGTPLRRRYYAPATGREVERDDMVRGYEVERDSFVLVEDEELEALEPDKSRDIDLRRFVDRAELDPIWFERAYFLTPDGGSTKAYRLLAETMERTGRAGIATFVMRGTEYLVAIIAEQGILRAETLRFADEVRTPDDVGLPEPVKPKPDEVKRMQKAMGPLETDELDEDDLRDRWSERVEKLARSKAKKGKDVVHLAEEESEPEEEVEVIDLMEVLKRSLAGGRGGRSRETRSADDLASRTKDELYHRAQELDIPGRSSMTKDELVAALRRSA